MKFLVVLVPPVSLVVLSCQLVGGVAGAVNPAASLCGKIILGLRSTGKRPCFCLATVHRQARDAAARRREALQTVRKLQREKTKKKYKQVFQQGGLVDFGFQMKRSVSS